MYAIDEDEDGAPPEGGKITRACTEKEKRTERERRVNKKIPRRISSSSSLQFFAGRAPIFLRRTPELFTLLIYEEMNVCATNN